MQHWHRPKLLKLRPDMSEVQMKQNHLLDKINNAIESIRPYLLADGGDIELVDLTEDNIVKVRLLGNCVTCPMSFMTLKAGIEEAIKNELPEIKGIQAINLDK
jgi:Fe-S cluster biogenesis protein NfuA